MVLGKLCISAMELIVCMTGPVLVSVDCPVTTRADLLKRARDDVGALIVGERCPEVVLIDKRV